MPGQRVRLDAKKAVRHQYCQEVAQLWGPVVTGAATLASTLEDGAKTSDKLSEIWQLVEEVQRGHASDDVASFLKAARHAAKVFSSIDDFYKCLRKLESKPGPAGGANSAVRVLTFRNSKGLEADCVFIVGLEDNSIPRDASDAVQTAEEARMMFVAMTRAKEELHLLHARKRTGAATFKPDSRKLGPSVFVSVLPSDQCARQYVAPESARKKKAS